MKKKIKPNVQLGMLKHSWWPDLLKYSGGDKQATKIMHNALDEIMPKIVLELKYPQNLEDQKIRKIIEDSEKSKVYMLSYYDDMKNQIHIKNRVFYSRAAANEYCKKINSSLGNDDYLKFFVTEHSID